LQLCIAPKHAFGIPAHLMTSKNIQLRLEIDALEFYKRGGVKGFLDNIPFLMV
jgi:hypothetical protein